MPVRAKDIIRVGDLVEVVVPVVVERVGYPKAVKDYRPEFDSEIHKMVRDLEEKIYGYPVNNIGHIWGVGEKRVSSRFENSILDIVQYHLAKVDGFGGRQRSLHLREVPDLLGKRARVQRRRQVQTGRYYPASGGGYNSYAGDYDDWEPGGLAERKDYVLMGLSVENMIHQIQELGDGGVDYYLPVSNLKKIEVAQ